MRIAIPHPQSQSQSQSQSQQTLPHDPPSTPRSHSVAYDRAAADVGHDERERIPTRAEPQIYALAHANEFTAISANRTFFNRPRLVNGQFGYPLSPIGSPRLPTEKNARSTPSEEHVEIDTVARTARYSKHSPGVHQEPVAGPSHEPVASPPHEPVAGPSGWRPPSVRAAQIEIEVLPPVRTPRKKELPLPMPPTARELLFYREFHSIDDANRQLGHLKMDSNPAWLNMGTKEPHFGTMHESAVGPFSNEKNSPFMKRWQEVWGTDKTKGKNFSSIWQGLIKDQQSNFKQYVDNQTMDLALFNAKFQNAMHDPDKSVPKITPNTYRNELTARQDFKRDLYLLQREALNESSPIFKLDSRPLKSLKKLSFKWPMTGEGSTVSKLLPYRKNDDAIQYFKQRKTRYEDALYRFGNDDNSMNSVLNERSRLQKAFHDEISGFLSDRQLKAQLDFWNWSKVNVAGGVVGFHLVDYLRKKFGE